VSIDRTSASSVAGATGEARAERRGSWNSGGRRAFPASFFADRRYVMSSIDCGSSPSGFHCGGSIK
jgi:hypothetical protein